MSLKGKMSLLQATALNMIDMVGIGPFVVLPLVIKMMGGPHFIWAWVLGAVISLVDGMIWSELGAAYPMAGGSYNFLKQAYPGKTGKTLSFLYVWQTMIQAPLVLASGAIGFAQYCTFLYPFTPIEQKIISGTVVLLITFLLYRKIETIAKITVTLWTGVILTMIWLIIGGITHGTFGQTVSESFGSFQLNQLFFIALGQASVKTIYSFLGYYNVCHLGGEINNPQKTIPQSIIISVVGITILYCLMNLSVVSVIPWHEAQNSEFIVSTFIEKIYGHTAATVATGLILWIAFASLFAVLLGYSRIPYAAAADGAFFKVFAKLHPTKNFPYISLLVLGGAGFIFSLLFKLSDVISAILAMRILVQFIGQAIGAALLRKRKGTTNLPFKMPLYPLPIILAITIWLFIFISTGLKFALSGITIIVLGLLAYNLFLKKSIEDDVGQSK